MNMGSRTPIIKITKLRYDTEEELSMSSESDWGMELLAELQEEVDPDDLKESGDQTYISFKGTVKKKKNTNYQEVILISGELKSSYKTYCVSSGALMTDHLEVDVEAAAIELSFKDEASDENEELIEIEVDGQEYDLYYYSNNELDLKHIFHEYLFLNKNPYPRLD